MIPERIRAKRGDLILPKWRALLDFIASTGIVTGPGVRITQGPNGTIVHSDHFRSPWQHPFKVSYSSDGARVRSGLVNGIAPFITSDVRVSGLYEDGAIADVPAIEVESLGTTKSAIALEVTVEEGNDVTIIDDYEHFRIVHTEITDDSNETIESDSLGNVRYPLSIIYWDDDSISKTYQVVYHNLGYRFLQGSSKEGRPVRHFFWAT